MADRSTHAMFPQATHDEQVLQDFIKSLRIYASRNFHANNRALLQDRIEPRLRRKQGARAPTRKALREAFGREPSYRWYSAMLRTTQEMLYDTVGPSIERQLPDLIERANALRGRLGSLHLDPGMRLPRYFEAIDYHCKPGSYQQELTADDVFPGAEFDRTYRLYSMGSYGPDLDGQGRQLIEWIKSRYPGLAPRQVLDLGCTVGHSTLPYVDAFGGNTDVHAVDVSAPCLRYGHARAVAMGKAVHFSQQNAEQLNFADDSFDLVVSHALLHETSHKAIRWIFKEAHRVLKPGGVMAHLDSISKDSNYDRFFAEWMAHFNNEPYLGSLQDEDFAALCQQAGFAAAQCRFEPLVAQNYGNGAKGDAPVFAFMVIAARKTA